MTPPTPAKLKKNCDAWNAKHPVGTKVSVRLDSGEIAAREKAAAKELRAAFPIRGTIAASAQDVPWLLSELTTALARVEEMRGALEWYGENTRLCRLVHSGGDEGRHALADDGGKRARAALQETERK